MVCGEMIFFSIKCGQAETLSVLETILLPSFFDIMVHLMVHLPTQARLAGPVHYRNYNNIYKV
jgi:hypothetical protein